MSNWQGIQETGSINPKYRMGKDIVLFGIDKKEYHKWQAYGPPDSPGKTIPIIEYLVRDRVGKKGEVAVRLEFDLEETDKVDVYDRSHIQLRRFKEFFNAMTRGEMPLLPDGLVESEKRYRASKTPLQEYDGSFLLPELCIKNSISVERLKHTATVICNEKRFEKVIPTS